VYERLTVLQQSNANIALQHLWYLTRASLLRSSIRIGVQVHSGVLLCATTDSRLCSSSSTTPGALQARLRNSVCDRSEHLVHVVSALSTGLEEQQVLLVRVVLALLRADPAHLSIFLALSLAFLCLCALSLLLVLREIELVADQRDHDARAGLSLQLGDPVLRLDQTAGLCDVVDDERALRIAVVHGRQAGEALLARGVPDFEFDGAVGQVAFLCQEGGADCGFFVGLEGIVDEAKDERGLQVGVSMGISEGVSIARWRTLPTAASPSSTSLTLLLGLGALGAGESDIVG
jgi:hypothetical protein